MQIHFQNVACFCRSERLKEEPQAHGSVSPLGSERRLRTRTSPGMNHWFTGSIDYNGRLIWTHTSDCNSVSNNRWSAAKRLFGHQAGADNGRQSVRESLFTLCNSWNGHRIISQQLQSETSMTGEQAELDLLQLQTQLSSCYQQITLK